MNNKTKQINEGLRRYLENKRNKPHASPCEQVLGTNTAVHAFAEFWEQHAEDLIMLEATILHKWQSKEEFNKEQLLAYRTGLSEISKFFASCALERIKAKEKALAEAAEQDSLPA